MRRPWLVFPTLLILVCPTAGRAQNRNSPAPSAGTQQVSQAPEELPLEEAVRRASVNGKYRTLLCIIRVPEDFPSYSAFSDYGFSQTPSWGGFSGLPPGY